MIYETGILSLIVQFITGVIGIYGLQIPTPGSLEIYRSLLKIELGVQIIEFAFYLFFFFILQSTNLTPWRYGDWFITTPTMLTTLMVYLSQRDSAQQSTLSGFFEREWKSLVFVFLMNALMLGLGFLGEWKKMSIFKSVFLGFVPFFLYFFWIYYRYVDEHSRKDQIQIFWYFFFVWSLYGVAALLPYQWKNVSYNGLDLFSKNVLGLFLVWILYKNYQK